MTSRKNKYIEGPQYMLHRACYSLTPCFIEFFEDCTKEYMCRWLEDESLQRYPQIPDVAAEVEDQDR